MSALRRLWRLPALAALLLGGLLYQLLAFPLIGARGRARAIRRWARMLLAVAGVRLRMRPQAAAPVPGGCLIVANHLSWLDIFVIHAFAPARFVAKAEMRGWPLIGLLCTLAGTLFIERHRRHAVRDVVHRAAAALRDGHRVGVFPEGTTGDGAALLRFHANLLQAAIEARAPLVPVALRYLDAQGRPSQAARFVGDTTFAQSVWRVAGEPATLAEVAVLPAVSPDAPDAPGAADAPGAPSAAGMVGAAGPAGMAPRPAAPDGPALPSDAGAQPAASARHVLARHIERAIGEALGLPAAR